MANEVDNLPTAHALLPFAVKHQVDARTVLRVLAGEAVRGASAAARAKAAADEWREFMKANAPKPARKRARAK